MYRELLGLAFLGHTHTRVSCAFSALLLCAKANTADIWSLSRGESNNDNA